MQSLMKLAIICLMFNLATLPANVAIADCGSDATSMMNALEGGEGKIQPIRTTLCPYMDGIGPPVGRCAVATDQEDSSSPVMCCAICDTDENGTNSTPCRWQEGNWGDTLDCTSSNN